MRTFLAFICLLFTAFSAFANEIENGAIDFIYAQQKNVTSDLTIANNKERFEALYTEIDKTFATENIYKFVLARNAKLFSEKQKQQIIEYFKKLILVTYAINSKINVGNLSLKINTSSQEKQQDGTYKITIDGNIIDSKKIELINVSFVVLYGNKEYRIFDIKIENLNMLITFRNMFNKMMQESYNDPTFFMKDVQAKLEEINSVIYGIKKPTQEKEVFILQ